MMDDVMVETVETETAIVPAGDAEVIGNTEQTQDGTTKDNKAGLIIGTAAGVGAGVLAGIGIVKLAKSVYSKFKKNKEPAEVTKVEPEPEPEPVNDEPKADEPVTERSVDEILEGMTLNEITDLEALIAKKKMDLTATA